MNSNGAVASADEPLTERGKCRPVLLGAGRHCFALCSPLQQPLCSPLQPPFLPVSAVSGVCKLHDAACFCFHLGQRQRVWLGSTNTPVLIHLLKVLLCDDTERRRQRAVSRGRWEIDKEEATFLDTNFLALKIVQISVCQPSHKEKDGNAGAGQDLWHTEPYV